MVTSQGDLHIRAARPDDGRATYSCLTFHALTGERRRSEPATLTVTGTLLKELTLSPRASNKNITRFKKNFEKKRKDKFKQINLKLKSVDSNRVWIVY